MRLGFTGTRGPITDAQYATLRSTLDALRYVQFHHGDCLGADSMAHSLVRDVGRGAGIYIHPPVVSAYRAFREGDVVFDAAPYLMRNRAIVDLTTEMLVLPNGPEQARSGTWSTVRYARAQGRQVRIIWPNGAIT